MTTLLYPSHTPDRASVLAKFLLEGQELELTKKGPQNHPLPINSLLWVKLPTFIPFCCFASSSGPAWRLALPSWRQGPLPLPHDTAQPLPVRSWTPLAASHAQIVFSNHHLLLSLMKSVWAVGETRGNGEDQKGCVKLRIQRFKVGRSRKGGKGSLRILGEVPVLLPARAGVWVRAGVAFPSTFGPPGVAKC